jgi:hypothetical protein
MLSTRSRVWTSTEPTHTVGNDVNFSCNGVVISGSIESVGDFVLQNSLNVLIVIC